MSSLAADQEIRVTPGRVIRSEWTKLRSVRSTMWSLFAAALFVLAVGIIVCLVFEARWPHLSLHDRADFKPLRASLVGVNLAQLAFGVLGVMVITGEYATGMIRSTLSAVPTRLPVLWSKALVFAVVAFAVSLPAVFIVFFAGQAILAGRHIEIALSHPGVVRALIGAALYMTVFGLFGLGIGAITRSTPGGISALVAIMFVIPPLVDILPSSITNVVDKFLPSNAGGAVWTINPDPHTLSPWVGLGVFCAWTALSLVLAAILLRTRDT